jgi:hypothetical protein
VLQISKVSMNAFEQASQNSFVTRAVAFLLKNGIGKSINQDGLRSMVENQMLEMQASGIESSQCIMLGISLLFDRGIHVILDRRLLTALRDIQDGAISIDELDRLLGARSTPAAAESQQ